MKSLNDIWGEIGSVPDEELSHVITKLFTMYEQKLKRNPQDEAALLFFRNLENAIKETSLCNLNRR